MLATPAPATSAPLLPALRLATRELHIGMEKRMPFFTPSLNPALYLRLLQAYYGFYQPLEALLTASALMPDELLPQERVKLPALVQDLYALGMSDVDIAQLPRCRSLPVVDSPGACLGVMYVLEGATLGGQLLRREVHARMGLDERSGAAFLDVYGDATGRRWKAFLNHLDGVPREAELIEAAAHAAHSTFASFERWLDSRKVLV
ncbi:biliverdin-producing heme oxygenase [Pseudomonas sp. v388]|uniref:biliverdin-producing heme oxygenase n=1 Tax=Pseudomonas sp. v388 TaxID=2479849 RepID=UPI000F780CCF|nr:biliverdin-producing heme oxygenase [Pseudomonas sp. v388]RRV07469.1 biliverdin-producing heme oxygenase [Pseudomonas sp. v388]